MSTVGQRRRTATSINLSVVTPLLLLLLLLPFASAQGVQKCDNKTKHSVCEWDVVIDRQSDCSVIVTERILLRESSDEPFFRVIQIIKDQLVSQLRHHRSGLPTKMDMDQCDARKDYRTLRLQTDKSSAPVEHIIKYRLSNAVRKFTQGCSVRHNAETDVAHNVMRWRTGNWQQGLQRFAITYQAKGMTLKLQGDGGNEAGTPDRLQYTSDEEYDVDFGTRTRDFYIVELNQSEVEGTDKCLDLVCLTTATSSSISVAYVIVIIIAIIILLVLIYLYYTRRRANQQAEALEQQASGVDATSGGGGGGGFKLFGRKKPITSLRPDAGAGGGQLNTQTNDRESFPFGGDI